MGHNPSTSTRPATPPAWMAVLLAMAYAVVVAAAHFGLLTFPWPVLPVVSAVAMVVTLLVTVLQSNNRGNPKGWGPVYVYRAAVWMVLGGWATYVGYVGLRYLPALAAVLVGLTVGLGFIGNACPPPAPAPKREADPEQDRRRPEVRSWEASLLEVTGWPGLRVADVVPWDNPKDGETVTIALPTAKGKTIEELSPFALNIGGNRRLPTGCAVEFEEADAQGVVLMDVMRRNTLAEDQPPYQDPATEASINDDFPLLLNARKRFLTICLRYFVAVVGGMRGSGKTTLLHRIIMHLARCTDTLIWVCDVAGGGIAEPWTNAWRTGRAARPTVDWVATDYDEAAGMIAGLLAVLRDRKKDPEAIALTRRAGNFLLPVSSDYPAILLIVDEGGEIQQALTPFASAAAAMLPSVVELGRAMAAGLVLSVLRGTADLTAKRLRVQAAIRICLRMKEAEEYQHILDSTPRSKLTKHKGMAYLRDDDQDTPVIGRGLNVTLAGIDAHSIATARLRPTINDRARKILARVTPAMVLAGRAPTEDLMTYPVLRDALAGLLYENRDQRYLDALAAVDLDDEDNQAVEQAPAVPATVAPQQDALGDLAAGMHALMSGTPAANASTERGIPVESAPQAGPGGRVIQLFPNQRPAFSAPSMPATNWQRLLGMLEKAGRAGLAANEIEAGLPGVRSGKTALMRRSLDQGVAVQINGRYVLKRHVVAGSA